MKTIFIEIDNLKCSGCENTIRKQLSKLEHVKEVKTHLENSAVEITYEGDIDEGIFYKTLDKLGYPVKGTSNTLQSIKSYVSCAMGRLNAPN